MPAEGSLTTVKVREQNQHLDIFYRLIHTVTHINNPNFCSTGPFQRLRGYSVIMPVRTTPYHTTPQPFYGPFSRTTWVNQSQKRISGLYGARED